MAFLDHHRGLLRWHIHYNLLVLRLISFAADLHWARAARRPARAIGGEGNGGGSSAVTAAGPAGGPSPDCSKDVIASADGCAQGAGGVASLEQELKARVETPLPLPYYNLWSFLEYVLYPPLYVAGPIITFNSFASQRVGSRVQQLGPRQVVMYALRASLAWACLEFVTHALPYNSIAKHRVLDWLASRRAGAGPAPRPLHYAITGYWVLVFMWLKFTVIWRFFRAVALADGVVPPENMTRCVCNNYDIEAVKALGRAARRWHGTAVFRHVAALAAAANILLLMAGNLVGFVVGLDGIGPLAKQVLGQPRFLAVVLVTLFAAAQLMFWKRELEAKAAAREAAARSQQSVRAATDAAPLEGGSR
ncbi:hypothetical protein GPECTOR_11g150 [Gonium pectorale]|uniref:Uncharacterized protein n=1 Tax=Gonium pectorale TaxID=33097 RepID=A0A150GPG8_GONPE|nr:hypothetical protein GPECTOR_11g150 [Gonium pectorale]|eukprot:KXZ51701.1 hypothetical protein GPECTOR_11g150 [Gonium pectorale]